MQKGYIEDNLMEVSNTLTTLPDPVRAVFLKLVQCPSTDMIEKRSIAHFMLLLLKEQHNEYHPIRVHTTGIILN